MRMRMRIRWGAVRAMSVAQCAGRLLYYILSYPTLPCIISATTSTDRVGCKLRSVTSRAGQSIHGTQCDAMRCNIKFQWRMRTRGDRR